MSPSSEKLEEKVDEPIWAWKKIEPFWARKVKYIGDLNTDHLNTGNAPHPQPPFSLETQVKDTKLSPIIQGHFTK